MSPEIPLDIYKVSGPLIILGSKKFKLSKNEGYKSIIHHFSLNLQISGPGLEHSKILGDVSGDHIR